MPKQIEHTVAIPVSEDLDPAYLDRINTASQAVSIVIGAAVSQAIKILQLAEIRASEGMPLMLHTLSGSAATMLADSADLAITREELEKIAIEQAMALCDEFIAIVLKTHDKRKAEG